MSLNIFRSTTYIYSSCDLVQLRWQVRESFCLQEKLEIIEFAEKNKNSARDLVDRFKVVVVSQSVTIEVCEILKW